MSPLKMRICFIEDNYSKERANTLIYDIKMCMNTL